MRIHVFESETRDIFHRSEDGKGVVRFFFHITTDADTVSIYYLEMQNILGINLGEKKEGCLLFYSSRMINFFFLFFSFFCLSSCYST